MAVDGKFIYWTNLDVNSIGRANLDGSSANPNFITAGVSSPDAIAVSGGFIYWVNNNREITRDTIDGNPANIVNLVTGVGDANGLAVDASHIYWGASGSTIGRANLDGSGANSSFITGLAGPAGLAVAGGFIYWADSNTGANGQGSIQRDTIDGNPANVTSLVSGLDAPFGVAVTSSHLYWSSRQDGTIGVANLDGTGENAAFIPTNSGPFLVAVDLPPSITSPPTINGSTVVGQALTETNGSWNANPTAFGQQWVRCDASGAACAPIAGATGTTYVLTPADASSTIRVQEIASNSLGGTSDPALSAPTGIVHNPPPPPSPPPPPPSATLASAAHSGATESLTLVCNGVPGQDCSINVAGTSHERKRAGSILAVTARERHKPTVRTITVTVLQGSFTVPAGQGTTVQVTLNNVGKQLVARFRTLPVTLSFTGSLTTTQTAVFRSTLTPLSVITPPDDWFHINLPCTNCFTMAQSVPFVGLPKGARVTVTCNGAGCSFAQRSVTPHHGHGNLAPVLGGSRLQPGTRVTVVISAPGRVSDVIIYTMQRGAGPVRMIE